MIRHVVFLTNRRRRASAGGGPGAAGPDGVGASRSRSRRRRGAHRVPRLPTLTAALRSRFLELLVVLPTRERRRKVEGRLGLGPRDAPSGRHRPLPHAHGGGLKRRGDEAPGRRKGSESNRYTWADAHAPPFSRRRCVALGEEWRRKPREGKRRVQFSSPPPRTRRDGRAGAGRTGSLASARGCSGGRCAHAGPRGGPPGGH